MMFFGRIGDQQKTFVQDTCQGDSGGPLWTDEDGQTHAIHQGEGGEQGDALMPALFCLGLHDALQAANA